MINEWDQVNREVAKFVNKKPAHKYDVWQCAIQDQNVFMYQRRILQENQKYSGKYLPET